MVTPYTLVRTAGPTIEPVTLAEAKSHCEISQEETSHDDKLSLFIESAREQVEHDTGYAIAEQEFTLFLNGFPCSKWIYLPVRPVTEISEIVYLDDEGNQQTLASDHYQIDPGRRAVYLVGDSWPSTINRPNSVSIEFMAGYEDSASIPSTLKQMVLLKVADQFADRGDMDGYMRPMDTAYERLCRKIMNPHYP